MGSSTIHSALDWDCGGNSKRQESVLTRSVNGKLIVQVGTSLETLPVKQLKL